MKQSGWGVFALALLASLSVFLLRLQASTDRIWLIAESLVVVVLCAWVRWRWILRADQGDATATARLRGWTMGIGVALILAPWLSRWVQTQWFGNMGEATELVWLAMLQMAALWQATVATTSRQDWLSFLMSCFLVIFGLATSDRAGMVQLVLPFAVFAAWWLMSRYWDSIEEGFIASESVPLVRVRLLVLMVLAGLGGLVVAIASRNAGQITSLSGFMPTSGGQSRGESWARQGIGDGDMLVAAKDEAYTFGPVDSELFMDSEVPSMYDLVSEIYGDPVPRQRQYARAISLENQVDEAKEEGSESKKNSREFSAHRRPKQGDTSFRPKGSDSKAVLYFVGNAPLHLRLESFDRFEEGSWLQSDSLDLSRRAGEPVLQELHLKPWMVLQVFPSELIYPVRERIATKIIQFQSPRLLSPSSISHVHIDRVDQPDFFGWTRDGQLMMPNRAHVPQLTVVHQLYAIPQLHPLRRNDHPMRHLAHQSSAHTLPSDWIAKYTQPPMTAADVRAVAQGWIANAGVADPEAATDWQRVEAIVRHLRATFEHDPSAVPPDDANDVIEHVMQQQRGPDYLIATTAVAMIRSLGIPCRLARGFMVSPDRYDRRAGQTAVLPEDIHTWAEVYAHGVWIPIEPTGTYPEPREHRTWQHWAIETGWAIRDAIRNHPGTAAAIAVCLMLSVYFRQRIAELLLGGVFLATCLMPLPWRILATIQLLRWRMWVWGESLAPRTTIQEWLSTQLSLRSLAPDHDHGVFIRAVQRMRYAPSSRRHRIDEDELHSLQRVCRSVCWSTLLRPLSLARPRL
ncbi:MAG: transglutaminase domain-containing protein [Pirellula sp.]